VSGSAALEPLPPLVRTAGDYEAHARARLDPRAFSYFDDVAGRGLTRGANRAAWDALPFWPRMLRAAPTVDLSTTLLGRTWPSPLLVAPMALQRLAHADGELATALAAAMQGAGMVLSQQSSVAAATVADAVRAEPGRGPLWFQLYLLEDRGATLEQVRRAEAAGYEALVLTVDATLRAPRPLLLPPQVRAVELPADPVFHPAPSWDDVAWLRAETKLPLLLKGVLHPGDAREAARLGVAGLIVSNHGGRILDGTVATATALPAVADAVANELVLLVDGGITSGTDVLKALALGARAVLLGRPVLYGLAAAGAAGAAHVLRLIRDELALSAAQCGLRGTAAATAALLHHAFA
jgi:4-hydroxymandelate oxidase